ncbi:hypothetical protein HQ587_08390 [bacterium]|nr:hypothetical protein [bacterium]
MKSAITFLIVCVLLLGCEEPKGPKGSLGRAKARPPRSEMQEFSNEYKLASIDAGYQIPKDHITVARFRSLIHQLSNTFVESKQEICDMTVTAQNLLKKEGIKENLLNIMEGMNQLYSTPLQNQKYSEYISAYVVLRKKGQTHSDVILDLQALLQVFGVN